MKKLFLLPLFILMCAAAFGQSAGQFYAEAMQTQDMGERLKLLNKAIEKNPRFTAAYHQRGDLYRSAGNLRRAVEDYTQTIKLAPQDPFRLYARALAYMDRKAFALAADDLTAAIKLKSDFDDFYYHRAVAYMELGKYNEALKDLGKIKNRRKRRADIDLMQARANFYIYNYTAARKGFEQILARSPDDTTALFYLGRINYNNEMYDEAISLFSKALNRDAAYANALRLRAAAYRDTGEHQAAIDDYTALIAINPDFGNYNRRGLVYEDIKDFKAAARDFSEAIALNPKWPIAYNNRGYAYLKLRDYKKAFEDLDAALKLGPNMPTIHINMAGYYWTARKDKKNMYKHLDLGFKNNFKDTDSLFEENKKGWLFKGINNTVEFRSFLSNYGK